MKLASFAVRRPVFVSVIVIITLLFGVVSLQRIGIDLLPNMNLPYAVVVTVYPNASGDAVEQEVTLPIEAALSAVSGVRRQDSYSMENISAVLLEFAWDTDMLTALENVRSNLAQATMNLPTDITTPVVVQIDPNDFPLMLIAVDAEDLNSVELSEELARIKPEIEQLPGVASVDLLGTSAEEIQVLFDPEQLDDAGLTPTLLQQLISYQNLIVPGGAVVDGDARYTTRTGRRIESVDELKDIIIGMEQGTGVLGLGGLVPSITYLSDIAEITTTVAHEDGITRYNGQDTILIRVMRQSGENTVQVANNVKDALSNIQAANPHLQFSVITDQSNFITNSIDSLTSSMILGGILAIAVLWLFLRNFGSLLIIALSIPISIIASFVLIYFSNLTFNLMTLGGLALGVGMLVDSSIVVLENIYRFRQEGISAIDAAEQGAGEVTSAIIASTVTTISVFLPVIFLDSLAGQLVKELGLTVSYSLIAAMLVALTLLPMLASKLLKNTTPIDTKSRKNKTSNGFFYRFQQGYLRALDYSLRRKGLVIGLVVLAIALAIAIIPQLGEEFLPSFDEGFLSVTAILPAGTSIDVVRSTIIDIENDLQAIPGIAGISMQAGDQGEIDVMSLVNGTGINVVSAAITLEPRQERADSDEITNQIQNIFDKHGVLRTTIVDSSLFGTSASSLLSPNLLVEIRGRDRDKISEISHEFQTELAKVPGFRSVHDTDIQSSEELFLKVDTARSILGGFTAGQVGLGVRYTTAGLHATELNIDGRTVPVMLRPELPSESVEELLNSKVTSPIAIAGFGETPIVLGQVVEPELTDAPPTIQRTDRMYVINVTGMLGELSLSDAVAEAERIIAGMELPAGYQMRLGGMQQIIEDSIDDLILAVGLGVILVYLVMAAQFESFAQPFIIMFSIPLALIGSLVGLWIIGGNLGIISFVGMLTLVGIVVNNAIVLVNYINNLRMQGYTVAEAVREACAVRLRPILMTTITTVLGLVPLVLGLGEGAEFQKALGVTISGGLITSTLLTLFVIPIIYSIFYRKQLHTTITDQKENTNL